ncbi:XdhC family protein [Muriicola marianensis]|uniref:Xanthine dehydrogenase subunit A n=1 Tax=Muriicola marianensis TaxID=1324801 RepID=A0ABQ1QRA2_9FLAO|nr:XdhC family protein [Muriicola marianensis]GGD38966.1 putative xanthine dehydrogenase subunit A [Muriicola marianensis]
MTHELKNIFTTYETAAKSGLRSVMATVVALNGSSYRKPGVRMLILENGKMEGAVSGGCVEKEIVRQAESVFSTGIPRVMIYDGRYRLGCEGILYILIEPFVPSSALISDFKKHLRSREQCEITSYFKKAEQEGTGFGSIIEIGAKTYPFHQDLSPDESLECFTQELSPSIRLFIIGSEHDAVNLSSLASQMGMEVMLVVNPMEEKTQEHFPGAMEFLPVLPETFPIDEIDEESAVVLMNHSYSKDLQFLIKLQKGKQFYTGILGPNKRREELLNELMEHCPEVELEFLDTVHGPAGIDIGAITPQEIAVSILSEVLLQHRGRVPLKLRDKKGSIHTSSS